MEAVEIDSRGEYTVASKDGSGLGYEQEVLKRVNPREYTASPGFSGFWLG
ncbi:MAG: hypothetical protein QXR36_02510 [Desulfurococcaceae archaeon]